ncbi:MAG: ABC transporter permease [Candidatus Aminicenantia bacterium]
MFKLAWRNIWRNKRRTILTISAIAFSIFLLSIMLSVQEGSYSAMLENATKIWNGKLRIFKKGYFGRESLSKSFKLTASLKEKLNALPGSWTERTDGFALVSYGDKTYGASITGIEPSRETKTTDIYKKVVKGRFLKPGDREVAIIGEKLAKNLKVELGDKIAVIAQGRDGSIGAKLLEIVGIFKTSILNLDSSKILINIRDSDELFSMDENITTLVIYFLEEKFKLKDLKEKLKSEIGVDSLEVIDWREIMPEVLEMIEFDRASGYIFYGILILIVAFGLLNTIYMTISERRKEIAVLRAIGMRKGKIVKMVILESIHISMIGSLIGFLLSYPIILYFESHPIRVSGKWAEMFESFLFEPAYYFKLSPKVLIYLALLILSVSVLMAIGPASKAVRENLADQLKFEK